MGRRGGVPWPRRPLTQSETPASARIPSFRSWVPGQRGRGSCPAVCQGGGEGPRSEPLAAALLGGLLGGVGGSAPSEGGFGGPPKRTEGCRPSAHRQLHFQKIQRTSHGARGRHSVSVGQAGPGAACQGLPSCGNPGREGLPPGGRSQHCRPQEKGEPPCPPARAGLTLDSPAPARPPRGRVRSGTRRAVKVNADHVDGRSRAGSASERR